ncbi:segregation and condensation protein B [Micromonospora pallida]|uniref:Segregation and condensation protein B n=1 Tax=Micromonospora pallida TaxID=145854 RepID=A0A1C6SL10_9ACTN|nr:SMC-Scp complex subunit ScpB [Micromonospora pallida]SCL30102.1 segregation and condensation protein B [Micromonospora pallida]
MSNEERGGSLADQAAAWVPPWERRPTPVPDPAPDATSDADAESDADATPSTQPPAPRAPAEAEVTLSPAPVELPTPPSTPVEAGLTPPGEPSPPSAPAAPPEPTAADRGGEAPLAGPVATTTPGRGGRAARESVPTATPMDEGELRAALEAILLVVDEPVSELTLAQVLEQPAERVGAALDRIAAGYTEAGHGFELRRAAGGWRLYTRPDYAPYVERFILDGQTVRLTQAALETLAVVAYKQPVTRSRISAIRGVNCDGVIRTLVSRGLVEECGTEPESGAFLYRTTTLFLEKLGLNSVHDLPPLAPFLPDDVEEFADATR